MARRAKGTRKASRGMKFVMRGYHVVCSVKKITHRRK